MTQTLPLIALDDTVLFPHNITSLALQGELSEEDQSHFASRSEIILVLNKAHAEISFKSIHKIGIKAEIVQLIPKEDGTTKLVVEAKDRVRITQLDNSVLPLIATYTDINEAHTLNPHTTYLVRHITHNFDTLINSNKPEEAAAIVSMIDPNDAVGLSNLVCSFLEIDVDTKQSLLEELDIESRLVKIDRLLKDLIDANDLGSMLNEKIDHRIQEKREQEKKELLLREKLHAIQEELLNAGIDTGSEPYSERIKELDLPYDALIEINKEIAKLERIPSDSSEAANIRNYMDFVLNLPWKKSDNTTLDITRVSNALDDNHYGLQSVKDRILEHLAVVKLTGKSTANVICLVGPPGVGKTTIVKSVATALNRQFYRIALGGVKDVATLRGHRRAYIGAMPGKIISSLYRVKEHNPVILLDEIDKMATGFQGNPSAALLEILDPSQNHQFVDHYLQVPFDLSEIMFICTANDIHNIPPVLRDRMEVILLPGYTFNEKAKIVRNHFLPNQLVEHGLPNSITINNDALDYLILNHTVDAGLRELERELGKILRKLALKKIKNEKIPSKITKSVVANLLGKNTSSKPSIQSPKPGQCIALYTHDMRANTLHVEANLLPHTKRCLGTGNIHELIRERIELAWSFLKTHHDHFQIPESIFKDTGIHVHFHNQHFTKEGEGWGLSICAAMVSAITQKPIPLTYGFTGEITLLGDLIAVPDIQEKLLSARQLGLRKIIIPEANFRSPNFTIPNNLEVTPLSSLLDLGPLLFK